MRRLAGALVIFFLLALPWGMGVVPGKATSLYLSAAVAGALAWAFGQRVMAVRKILLAAVVTALLLVVCDAVLRSAFASAVYYRPHERFVQRWPPMPLVQRYRPNVVYDGATFGDLAAKLGERSYRVMREVRFETDSRGFANPQETAGPYDLVILGDSFGLGVGTTMPEAWAERLRIAHSLNVYNISMPGSPWQQLINLMIEGDRIQWKPGGVALLALFTGNDLDEPYPMAPEFEGLPWTTPVQRALLAWEVFRARSVIRRLSYNAYYGTYEKPHVLVRTLLGQPFLIYEPHVAVMGRNEEDVLRHEQFGNLVQVLERFAAVSRTRGARPLVVCFPSKEEVYSWALDQAEPWSTSPDSGGFARAVGAWCSTSGVPFHDLKPDFVAASREYFENRGVLLWWHDDTHWNAAGNEVAAQVIWNILNSM